MIGLLNDRFVNGWVLYSHEPETPDGRALMKRLIELYKFPVDSLILTPDLECVGSQNANKMQEMPNRKTEQYLAFLSDALTKFHATK